MIIQNDLARQFFGLHQPGNPVVIFNIWDPGSAKAVADAGAKAIGTGSFSVASAFGFADGESMPLDLVIDNTTRITAAVNLPVTLDFEGGYDPSIELLMQNMVKVLKTGAVGVNFEDQIVGGEGLHDLTVQIERIRALRTTCTAFGVEAFINARTDCFLQNTPDVHGTALVDQAIERGHAYAEAGASGFFVPGLIDPNAIERVCAKCELPVNAMMMNKMPSRIELQGLGVARISYGPGPWRNAMAYLSAEAKEVLGR
ncbi:MAG: isocitrate lyase/phosphoenolpyruvate mutase family protein [Aquidulcibacter sp.]|jgi:2-methylisocitrate lyase-like PEP mutase family enzyme|uniref:isocitrate lyase/PEP mutase family protein n=1 Tax=Aquidulcibacter sp. TaxID=2052990 RepID=UPI0022BFCC22|nr:isocitrate lyase/phosphoenolpyruvate mutase family protein [Aquidulcibacter sp.]